MTYSAKLRIFFRVCLRYLLPVAALVYLFYSFKDVPPGVLDQWSGALSGTKLLGICFLLGLSLAHWVLEAIKWQRLVSCMEAVGLMQAFGAVIYGLSLGVLTPKRTGEYIGRARWLEPHNRISGAVVNLPGSLAQLLATLLFGLVALGLVLNGRVFEAAIFFGGPMAMLDGWLPVVVTLLLLLGLLLMGPVVAKYSRSALFPSWLQTVSVLGKISTQDLFFLVVLSCFRYLIFVVQFYLLLRMFQTPMPFQEAFVILALIYLVMAMIPVSTLAEAGVKGSVALLVLGVLMESTTEGLFLLKTGVVAGLTALWVINLMLPAAIGALLGLWGIPGAGLQQKPPS